MVIHKIWYNIEFPTIFSFPTGLILNSEPYFNEAGYEERRTDPIYQEQSRIYNEAVIALNLQSMISIVQNPFPIFRKEIIKHCVDKCKK